MSSLEEIIDIYFHKTSDEDRWNLSIALVNIPRHKNFSLFRWYKHTVNKILTSDETNYVSGFVCFVGSILFGLACDNDLTCIDELFRYSTLYILLDHYLDDPTNEDSGKRRLIKLLTKIFVNIGDNHYDNPNLDAREIDMIASFNLILKKNPDVRSSLAMILSSEIGGYRLQSDHSLTREEYLSIAINKGGHSLNAIEAILKMPISTGAFNLGACIQLDDDLRDVASDMRDNINTIATHDLVTTGNLDELALYQGKRIHALEERFVVFKVVLMGMLVHTVVVNSYFSERLRDSVEEYMVIDKRITHELIMKIIMEDENL